MANIFQHMRNYSRKLFSSLAVHGLNGWTAERH